MSTSIEDILNGSGAAKSAPEPQAEQPAHQEPEATPAQDVTAPGETEQSAQDAAPPAATVDESLDKKISAFQRKAEDETRKRQELERKYQESQRLIEERDAYIRQEQERQQQAAAKQQADVDLYDPDVLQQYVNGIVKKEQSSWQQTIIDNKIVMSQELMAKHDDYKEHEELFAQEMLAAEAKGDYSLRNRMESDLLPAKFAYDYAKRMKAMREIGDDPTTYKERVIAEYLASQGQQPAASQPVAQAQTLAKPVPQPPKTLAGVPSAPRDAVRHPWKGPTPLDQLLS